MSLITFEADMILAPPVVQQVVPLIANGIAAAFEKTGQWVCIAHADAAMARTVRDFGGDRSDLEWIVSAHYATALALQAWDDTEAGNIRPAHSKSKGIQ